MEEFTLGDQSSMLTFEKLKGCPVLGTTPIYSVLMDFHPICRASMLRLEYASTNFIYSVKNEVFGYNGELPVDEVYRRLAFVRKLYHLFKDKAIEKAKEYLGEEGMSHLALDSRGTGSLLIPCVDNYSLVKPMYFSFGSDDTGAFIDRFLLYKGTKRSTKCKDVCDESPIVNTNWYPDDVRFGQRLEVDDFESDQLSIALHSMNDHNNVNAYITTKDRTVKVFDNFGVPLAAYLLCVGSALSWYYALGCIPMHYNGKEWQMQLPSCAICPNIYGIQMDKYGLLSGVPFIRRDHQPAISFSINRDWHDDPDVLAYNQYACDLLEFVDKTIDSKTFELQFGGGYVS